MSMSNRPVYPVSPISKWGPVVTTANTAKDGTGTVATLVTAGANGARIDKIQGWALGTNASATVCRLFVNNGSDNSVAANNCLFREYTCAATTASETAALTQSFSEVFTNLVLEPGYKINMTIGTTVATGIQGFITGGDY